MVPAERRFFAALITGWGVAALLASQSVFIGAALALTVLLALGALLALGSARPELQWFGTVVSRSKHPNRIALTIDDGPDPATTPLFLEILAKHGAHATFFLLTDRAAKYPALVRQIADQGHEIGLHGLRHEAAIAWCSPREGARWLREGLQGLQDLGVDAVPWFRPPFGVVSPRTFLAAAEAALGVAWCSIRTGDGVAVDVLRFRKRALAARGGDVVLMHDGNATTIAELPSILTAWTSAGFEITGFDRAQEAD